jgi:hypothetical protein
VGGLDIFLVAQNLASLLELCAGASEALAPEDQSNRGFT